MAHNPSVAFILTDNTAVGRAVAKAYSPQDAVDIIIQRIKALINETVIVVVDTH